MEFAIFQATQSFTILQFYAQRCNRKLTSRQAVPTVNSASVIKEQGCIFSYKKYQFSLLRARESYFYRAMLCIRGTSHGAVSVRSSVRLSQVGVLLKRLNVASHKQHRTIAGGLWFSGAKDLREIRPGSSHARATNAGGVGQNLRHSTNNGYISKTVQDRRMVSIKVE